MNPATPRPSATRRRQHTYNSAGLTTKPTLQEENVDIETHHYEEAWRRRALIKEKKMEELRIKKVSFVSLFIFS